MSEFNILLNEFLKKDLQILNFEDISELYTEISAKAEFDRYLLKSNIFSLYKGACIQLNNDNFDIELFTNENHENLIRNMPKELLNSNALHSLYSNMNFSISLF